MNTDPRVSSLARYTGRDWRWRTIPRLSRPLLSEPCDAYGILPVCIIGRPWRAFTSSHRPPGQPLKDRTMSKLTTLEMFAGIAGFSVGLERTGGFETVGFIEKDDYCQRVLAKNFPGIPCHDDVTTYQFQEGEADVITAGFPCQDVSFAGAGAGLSGARSGLYREVIRAIRVVRPQHAVLENVAALLGRGLDTVLGDLAEIGNDAEWHCIPASAVGAPHRRDRIWIIANPGGEQHEGGRAPLSGPLAEELSRTYPDAARERCREAGQLRHDEPEERLASICEDVADSGSPRPQIAWPIEDGEDGQQSWGMPSTGSWWAVEPDVGRVAHGVPDRAHRLRALGNAIVPQVATLIGQAILQSRAEA